MQDKEEMIGNLKEEIDMLNRVSGFVFHFLGFSFWSLDESTQG